MICQAPFFPNRGNYTTGREHDGNQRKSWFLILRTGLFTKKVDTEFQAQTSGSPVLTFRTRAEAEAHWAANCREFHLHGRDNNNEEGSEEEGNDSSLPPSPPPSPTPATSTPRSTTCARSTPGKAVRSVKRKVRASVKREASAPLLVKEEPEAPLFREDGNISPLSRPRKRLTPPSPLLSRRRSTSQSAHSVSLRMPGPDASPSCASPPSTGMSTGSISSVSSLSASVPSSGSCAAPPLRSLQGHPRSSRPVVPYLHAGGWATAGASSSTSTGAGSSASTGASSSASAATGVQSRRHAEPPVLFNNSTRTLYKDA
ncbi:hypothetical protein DFH09DRAFT_1322727 [Mycena vulgaris]|nr:hypothetical protein DFH09DRAFT_1322727 [Mycena vulgaris]